MLTYSSFNFLNHLINTDSKNPAIISSGVKISYSLLVKSVNVWSDYLSDKGVCKGMHVALLSDNSVNFIILTLAVWKLRAVLVPLNVRLNENEINELIQHSGSQILFLEDIFRNKFRKTHGDCRIEIIPSLIPGKNNLNALELGLAEEETAVILYTSGTTGQAKGVMLSFKNLTASALAANSILQQTSSDRWLASLPFYHVGGFSIFIRAFLFGASVIIPDSLKQEEIVSSLHKYNPTLVSFVSTTLRRMLNEQIKVNNGLRFVLLGGGPIEDTLCSHALEMGWNIIKVYGSTESAALVTAINLKLQKDTLSSAGKPLGNNKISIIDKNGMELTAYQQGEIVISGDSLARQYWHNEEETAKKMKDEKYFTGDIGYLDDDGNLFIEARRNDLIISGGENINPLEVEKALLLIEGIREVAVFPLKDEQWGQTVAAAIVQKENSQLDASAIITILRKKIAAFKLPHKIFFLEELPKTSLGKIKKEVLKNMYENLS